METYALDDAVRQLAGQISGGTPLPDVAVGELLLGVRVRADTRSDPADSDEYGPADVETFRDGEWRFVELRVVAAFRGLQVTSSGTDSVELGRTEGDIETAYLEEIIHGELNQIIDTLPAIIALLTLT